MSNIVAFPVSPAPGHDTAFIDGEVFTLCDPCEDQGLDMPRVVTVSRRTLAGCEFDEYRCKACRKVIERIRRTDVQSEQSAQAL